MAAEQNAGARASDFDARPAAGRGADGHLYRSSVRSRGLLPPWRCVVCRDHVLGERYNAWERPPTLKLTLRYFTCTRLEAVLPNVFVYC